MQSVIVRYGNLYFAILCTVDTLLMLLMCCTQCLTLCVIITVHEVVWHTSLLLVSPAHITLSHCNYVFAYSMTKVSRCAHVPESVHM
jgi:hypothetical protein